MVISAWSPFNVVSPSNAVNKILPFNNPDMGVWKPDAVAVTVLLDATKVSTLPLYKLIFLDGKAGLL